MLSAPAWCPFAPRCRYQLPRCTEELPLLAPIDDGEQQVACFNPVATEAWAQSRVGGAA